jgi:hypothetical protein
MNCFCAHWTYCKVIIIYICKKCELIICNNCMHKDESFTIYIQIKFNDCYFLCSLCTNCHWDAQSIQCSFYKYKFILIWWLLIVLNCIKFKFSLSVNSATSYHHCVVTLSAVLTVIIDDITLSVNYDYLSAENVSSTVNKLKITAKILYCWAEKLNINVFIASLMLSLCLHQLHSHSSLCYCNK